MALLNGQLRDDRKQDEKGGGALPYNRGPQVGLEPQAAAAKTKPLHMGSKKARFRWQQLFHV